MTTPARLADPAPASDSPADATSVRGHAHEFDHVCNWVFDLDNTLYPAECHLFKQIDMRMSQFIQRRLLLEPDAARIIQKDYYARYGTTLSGLMHEHKITPDEFLSFVHDIDLTDMPANDDLAAHVRALPGDKYIFTNGSVAHAENVLTKLGFDPSLFVDIFDIRAAEFTPKPHRATYERFLARGKFDPREAAMFEDLAHNLEAAHDLGMRTVLIASGAEWFADEPAHKRPARPGDVHDHVHHVTDDITGFVGAIVEHRASGSNR